MKKRYGTFTGSASAAGGLYDYSSVGIREETIGALVDNSALARGRNEAYWRKMRRYYDGVHDIGYLSGGFLDDMKLPWNPAQSADGFVHVESQIDSEIPDFEFSPRGKDGVEAVKRREDAVKRICEINGLNEKNTRNERRLNIYGSAVWKVAWGKCADGGRSEGDVTVEAPLPEQIYMDPAALTVEDAEYIAFIYRMHKQKVCRVFGEEIQKRGENAAYYFDAAEKGSGVIFGDSYGSDDSVTVTEFWFRQPKSGDSDGAHYEAGDIAFSVLIGGKEVRYEPNYWRKTHCGLYPFVIYCKTPNEGSVWGKSELEQLIPLIDAADRELTFAQLNGAFGSNDVILAEENAFAEGETPDNAPGAVWKLRPGMMGKVQRLGNLGAHQNALMSNYALWQSMMEQTTGNFEVNQGKEPARVTTATGIALMNERAKSRLSLKKTGRSEGFRRLYRLMDYTALEFYGKGRKLETAGGGFIFDGFAEDAEKEGGIVPVDIKIHVGDGIANSKAFTVSAVSALMGTHIDRDNYPFVKAYVDLIGLPMRNDICAYLDAKFGDSQPKQSEKAAASESMEQESKTVSGAELLSELLQTAAVN